MPSCHERNNAASQLCYYIACVIVICVVSAIMSRAKYALNTRYARKQNLKLRCTYLRCIFVLDFCRTIVFGHFCLPQSCLLPDHCFWSLLSAAKFFCRTVVFGHHFPSPFPRHFLAAKPSDTKCVKVVVAQEAWHVFDSNTHPGVSFSHVLIGWCFTRLGSSQDQSDRPPSGWTGLPIGRK